MATVSENETPTLGTSSRARFLGRVKWFNTKAGYGFITASEGERENTDIFVHHSGIRVENEQYRYLVEGEYIEFSIRNTPGAAHEIQAEDVSGIRGGKLMCETRRDYRETRRSYQESNGVPSEEPKGRRAPKSDEGWTLNQSKQREGGSQGRGKGQGRGGRGRRPTLETA
jgi:cold shock protein